MNRLLSFFSLLFENFCYLHYFCYFHLRYFHFRYYRFHFLFRSQSTIGFLPIFFFHIPFFSTLRTSPRMEVPLSLIYLEPNPSGSGFGWQFLQLDSSILNTDFFYNFSFDIIFSKCFFGDLDALLILLNFELAIMPLFLFVWYLFNKLVAFPKWFSNFSVHVTKASWVFVSSSGTYIGEWFPGSFHELQDPLYFRWVLEQVQVWSETLENPVNFDRLYNRILIWTNSPSPMTTNF